MPSEGHLVDHFLYFSTRKAAEDFARVVQRLGLSTAVSDADPRWLVTASRTTPVEGRSLDADTEALTKAAEELGGIYDGYERSTARRPMAPPESA
jgi:hypothetical protein